MEKHFEARNLQRTQESDKSVCSKGKFEGSPNRNECESTMAHHKIK